MSLDLGSTARRGVTALVFGALALGLAPDPIVTVTAWADENRIVSPEESPVPGRWKTDLVPYMREIQDCLSPSDESCREVVFKKSHQVAGTQAGINLFGTVVDKAPGPMLVVLPTVDEAKKYVAVKLQPAIDATPALKAKVRQQRSRSERGSTTLLKKFPGGFAVITGANSSAGLQMISVRYIIMEEISEWPLDVDKRGDPVALALARSSAFTANRKIFYCSTPGIKGMCRISARYEASDQREYHVPCPHCGHMQVLRWERLRYRETAPHEAVYECEGPECGALIEHAYKTQMIAAGEWRAKFPGEGRHPGFHINQLYSPFVPWDDTVADWLEAKGDPVKEKVFTQQVLGEAYEAKGEAPDYLKLFARREEFPLGRIPAGGLFLTLGADVQADRIEWDVWAWGVGKSSWHIDTGVVQGDTADLATWVKFSPVLERQYEDWQGKLWPIEAAAIDSGYNTQTVYAYVRTRGDRVIAIKGMPGHLAPALGTPTKQDVDWKGARIKGGVLLWPVGTWSLKAELYANLRKTIAGPSEDGTFPPGYVHLSTSLDEAYLQQLTAEYLVTSERKGYQVQEWVKAKDSRNEKLDTRIYATAAAVHLGIDRLTPADWQYIIAERGAPPVDVQLNLAGLWAPPPGASAAAEAPAADQAAHGVHEGRSEAPKPARGGEAGGGSDWFGGRGSDWFGRA